MDRLNGHTLTPEERMAAMAAAQDLVRRLQGLKAPQRDAALELTKWLFGVTPGEERVS